MASIESQAEIATPAAPPAPPAQQAPEQVAPVNGDAVSEPVVATPEKSEPPSKKAKTDDGSTGKKKLTALEKLQRELGVAAVSGTPAEEESGRRTRSGRSGATPPAASPAQKSPRGRKASTTSDKSEGSNANSGTKRGRGRPPRASKEPTPSSTKDETDAVIPKEAEKVDEPEAAEPSQPEENKPDVVESAKASVEQVTPVAESVENVEPTPVLENGNTAVSEESAPVESPPVDAPKQNGISEPVESAPVEPVTPKKVAASDVEPTSAAPVAEEIASVPATAAN